jgi:hypothetical protein
VTLPTLPGITGRTVAGWVTDRLADVLTPPPLVVGSGAAYLADGRLLAQPDRLVVMTRTGGPGLAFEGIFDAVSFQARVRGAQNDGDDAEQIALAVDSVFIDAKLPVDMGPNRVPRIDRIGGGPAYYTRDSAGRTHFTGNYLLFATR